MRQVHLHGWCPKSQLVVGRLRSRRCCVAVPVACASYSRYAPKPDSIIQPVAAYHGHPETDTFRSLVWVHGIPSHMKKFHAFPAMQTWFTRANNKEDTGGELVMFGDKLSSSHAVVVSYEFIVNPHSDQSSSSEYSSSDSLRNFQTWLTNRSAVELENTYHLSAIIDQLREPIGSDQSHFLQFEAPLSLIALASHYNASIDDPSRRLAQLYVAQSDIRDLPKSLREDLPVPEIVSRVGRGDIYSTSIWLGLQPTYTPLHRDPNPNLFCQVAGSKVVRLLRPGDGESMFRDIRKKLGLAIGSSRFRGPGMMDGPERDELHRAVWTDEPEFSSSEIRQAVLDPGDALFIPQGWWHSVRSIGPEAQLNASVNWWFR